MIFHQDKEYIVALSLLRKMQHILFEPQNTIYLCFEHQNTICPW